MVEERVMSARAEALPKPLIVAVLVMTLVVLTLGGAVLAVRLRPDPTPRTTAERVLANWEGAVDQDPESDTAHTGLGLALIELGRTDDAREAFVTAVELNPKNWMANLQLGLMMRETNPERAVALLEASAKYAAPGDKAVPLIAEGDFLLEQGDAEGAKAAYRRSIADASYLFDSHYGLGQALEQLGEKKAAIEEYRAAGRFSPGDPRIEEAIARLQEQS
jgi:tetratricopeptide (TPR) repeat protein